MNNPKTDFLHILRILSEHQVDFIVVGGLEVLDASYRSRAGRTITLEPTKR